LPRFSKKLAIVCLLFCLLFCYQLVKYSTCSGQFF
jgi:hypothetical protein